MSDQSVLLAEKFSKQHSYLEFQRNTSAAVWITFREYLKEKHISSLIKLVKTRKIKQKRGEDEKWAKSE